MKVSKLVIDSDLTACKRIKYTIQAELTEVSMPRLSREALRFLSPEPFTVIILSVALSQDRELVEALARPGTRASCRALLQCVRFPCLHRRAAGWLFHGRNPLQLETGLRKARESLQVCGPSVYPQPVLYAGLTGAAS